MAIGMNGIVALSGVVNQSHTTGKHNLVESGKVKSASCKSLKVEFKRVPLSRSNVELQSFANGTLSDYLNACGAHVAHWVDVNMELVPLCGIETCKIASIPVEVTEKTDSLAINSFLRICS